jgi:hypothetical protein
VSSRNAEVAPSTMLFVWTATLFDEGAPGGPTFDDVAVQTGDLSFVADEVAGLYSRRVGGERVVYAGFSMGAVTALGATSGGTRAPRRRSPLPANASRAA